jgi:hypothetical protein
LQRISPFMARCVTPCSASECRLPGANRKSPTHARNDAHVSGLFSVQANPPPKVGRWRLLRGSDDRNRVHVVGEVAASEVKGVKEFLGSQHMQDVFKRVNAMSTAPQEIIWLEELAP